ncbi:hypothetical protein [Pseudochrobactrum saccharolyticum]|uniref:hypothetical protein n=1 Tax=Pseudochrobactrum saccharolyticum TaxID=354352 RepID=UPI00276DAC79|nr:hypothetical protein [Pseudochrobactrum saccharolyticum]MDP8250385.1 hypothetical protein [Pseudochrobactrum saccharolyticum]
MGVVWLHMLRCYSEVFFQPNRIIAISPRFELDPRKHPFDSRALAYTETLDLSNHSPIAEVASSNLDTLIIFDPFMPEDSAHAKLYKNNFPEWTYIQMPFGGHPAFSGLKHTGTIAKLAEILMVGDHSTKKISSIYRTHKRSSPYYWYNLGMHSKSVEAVKRAHKFVSEHGYSRDGWADEIHNRMLNMNGLKPFSKATKKRTPTTEDIQFALKALDKKYTDKTMIVDVILDIANQLETVGSFEYALMQYKIAKCKWPSNENISLKISQIESLLEKTN